MRLHLLVGCSASQGAVILVATIGVLHPSVNDVADGNVHVIAAQILQGLHHLVSFGLGKTKENQMTNPDLFFLL